MPQLHVYQATEDLPAHYEYQIRSFMRILWPGHQEDDLDQPLTEPELHPTYFVLATEHTVMSYARTIWMPVSYAGQTFKLYGLGDVLTLPASRHQGYGGQIVAAATAHICADAEADAAILLTEPRLENFYRRSGWEHIPHLTILTGEHAHAQPCDAFPMMLFLSPTARNMRTTFQTQPLFLPGEEW